MEQLDFPPRQFTVGQEPVPAKSIGYYSSNTRLFSALREALNEKEWEELKESKLGVFLKFYELEFSWASRLVHYMLTFQLDCKKKYELWSLIGVKPVRFSLNEFGEITGLNCEYVKNLEHPLVEVTDEMKAFWELLGVNFERGPSIDDLTTACARCETWSTDDRKRLGYLAIYAGFIEAQRTTTPTRAALARLVMDLEVFEDYPWGRVAFKGLMDSVKKADLTKTSYYLVRSVKKADLTKTSYYLHALGLAFPFHDFCDKNVKQMRAKLAAEIFDETNINGTETREYKTALVYE